MHENSSKPPVASDTIKTPPTFDNDFCRRDDQPSTADIIANDGLLRDTWVSLRRPCRISEVTNPQQELVNKIIRQFRRQGVSLNARQVAEVVETILEKKLIEYHPESQSYYPTQKTQRLMDVLYIVFCDNCGASHIRLREPKDEIPTMEFCYRCEEVV